MLTSDAFKTVLLDVDNHEIRKRNIKYYLFLEKSIANYNDYQIMYKDYILSGKDTKIDNLELQIKELLGYAKDTKDQNNKLQESLETVTYQNTDLQSTLDVVAEQNEELITKVDELRVTVTDRNKKVSIDPKVNSKLDMYALIRTDEDNRYKLICGQNSYVNRILKSTMDDNILINKTYNPNPKTMFVRLTETIDRRWLEFKAKVLARSSKKYTRQELKDLKDEFNRDNWIKYCYKTIIIKSDDYELDLIELVRNCDTERLRLDTP